MKVGSLLVVALGACFAFTSLQPTVAQDDAEYDEDDEDDDSHPLTNMPLSANFVNVAFKFEEQPSDGFTMGERVGVVVGVINTHATKEINVTSAMGSMNYPQDFSAYVANFSQQMFTANNIPVTIPPGQECSFTYNFYTPSALQVDYPYQMALSLFYEDDYELFSETFFNDTVTFSEPELEWDSKSIIETVLLFVLAIAMYLYSRKAWSPQATATGTLDLSYLDKVDNDWGAIKERPKEAKRLN